MSSFWQASPPLGPSSRFGYDLLHTERLQGLRLYLAVTWHVGQSGGRLLSETTDPPCTVSIMLLQPGVTFETQTYVYSTRRVMRLPTDAACANGTACASLPRNKSLLLSDHICRGRKEGRKGWNKRRWTWNEEQIFSCSRGRGSKTNTLDLQRVCMHVCISVVYDDMEPDRLSQHPSFGSFHFNGITKSREIPSHGPFKWAVC